MIKFNFGWNSKTLAYSGNEPFSIPGDIGVLDNLLVAQRNHLYFFEATSPMIVSTFWPCSSLGIPDRCSGSRLRYTFRIHTHTSQGKLLCNSSFFLLYYDFSIARNPVQNQHFRRQHRWIASKIVIDEASIIARGRRLGLWNSTPRYTTLGQSVEGWVWLAQARIRSSLERRAAPMYAWHRSGSLRDLGYSLRT